MANDPLLRDLLLYPIERYVPGVVKVGDTTEETAEIELGEYVVTAPIEEALKGFLEVYSESRTSTTERVGVWISGFFGSGKSHFAKILSYLLTNPQVGDRTAQHLFTERLDGVASRDEIEGLLHRAGFLDSRVIMFQIKAEEDQTKRGESISEIMYRRYLASRGLSTDPVVASLELSLIKRDLYEAFQAEVEKLTGGSWNSERQDYLFIRSTVAQALQAIAPDEYQTREEALEALEMVDHGHRLSPADLAERLAEYVRELEEHGDRERPPRLVFILDEIGQFIGTDGQKLLELQSIVEEFSLRGKGALWLVVTAQAKLEELIAGVKALEADFGKIGRRFDTRLALTSEDVDKVLEGRILKKKGDRVSEIEVFYHEHEGALSAISSLPGASRELPIMTSDHFTANAPFLPYHSPLIQAIFSSVKSAAPTGFGLNPEVRSMVGMAQGVLRNPANGFVTGELGRLVSMDMVFDQIAVDLQPRDRREIEMVPERLPGYQALDQRVLKALYLLQAVPWIAATAETLAHALVRDVRTENPATLKGGIDDSLKRLEEARYIVPKGDGLWEFLTGVKKSFEEEAFGVTVRQADRRRFIRKALTDVLRPIGKLNYKEGLRSFDVTVRGDAEELQSGGDISLEVYSPLHIELEKLNTQDLEQVESFSHPETVYWVCADSPDLVNHVTRAIRLDAVLEKWRSKAAKTEEEREIIREKETELAALRSKVETALRVSMANGTIIWSGHAEELDGRATTLNPIFNRHVSQVVPHVYPKFDLAAVKPNEDEIKAVLTVATHALPTVGTALDLFDDQGHLNQHCAVVEEVKGELEQRTNRGTELTGKALETHFTSGDYGWHPTILRLVLAAMFRSGVISAKSENVHYTDHTAPAAQALFTKVHPFRRTYFVYEEEEAVVIDELRQTQDELKLIFDAPRRDETANALADQISQEMDQWENRAGRVVLQLGQAGYPIPEALRETDDLVRKVTRFANPSKVVKAFLDNVDTVRQWHTEAQVLYEFIRDKRLPAFRRARLLLNEIERAQGVRGSEPLAEEDSQRWRERMQELIDSGSAAQEWDEFTSCLTPLQERFHSVYASLHEKRDQAVVEARERLEEASTPVQPLVTYECTGLKWVEEELKCGQCSAPLKELYLQTVALPNLVRELRDRYETGVEYGEETPSIRRLRVAEVVPKRRIRDEAGLAEALDALRSGVTEALGEVDVVELE